MSVISFTAPTQGQRPVVVEVPHAGLAIPSAVRDEIVAPDEALARDADLYVDELYADAPQVGATLLTALVSRYVVDLNRAPDDVDLETVPDHPAPRMAQPRGVVWRVTTEGKPALKGPLDFAALSRRLSNYHAPYHDKLRTTLQQTRESFGYAILIAGHSMPSTARRGRDVERRADVVPGSLGGTSAHHDVIEFVDQHFRAAGLSVRHDDPYRGGFSTAHYGRPQDGVHAIQIELNRALYMDELTCQRKPNDFQQLQKLLRDLVERLGELSLGNLRG
jgi:N-formylglutamate amidohydrolase